MNDRKMSSNGAEGDDSLVCLLAEAGLGQYLASLRQVLHVFNVSQLKYVEASDLYRLGMSKPEVRRLKNAQAKHRNASGGGVDRTPAKHSKYTAKIRNFLQVNEKFINEIGPSKLNYSNYRKFSITCCPR